MTSRSLFRLDPHNAWIAGICAGVAQRLNVDVTLCRLILFITGLFFTKWVIAAYVITWFVLDDK